MASSSSKPSKARLSPPPASSGSQQTQNIWLAGLGALAKAQTEGSKAFDSLVQQGLALQNQTQALAKAQFTEAAQRIEAMTATAHPLGVERWGALEGIFEKRVANALNRLGLPDADALGRLESRVAALENALAALAADEAPPSPAPARTATKSRVAAKRAR